MLTNDFQLSQSMFWYTGSFVAAITHLLGLDFMSQVRVASVRLRLSLSWPQKKLWLKQNAGVEGEKIGVKCFRVRHNCKLVNPVILASL